MNNLIMQMNMKMNNFKKQLKKVYNSLKIIKILLKDEVISENFI